MPAKPYNIHTLPREYGEAFGAGAYTMALGRLGGSQNLTVNLDVVPPGRHSTRYHSHSLQEEFFFILQGEGTLRTPEGSFPVKPGAFFAKPCGPAHAHTFFNSGTQPLHILDVATAPGGDVAYYPDDDVYLLRDEGVAVNKAGVAQGWSSQPDADTDAL